MVVMAIFTVAAAFAVALPQRDHNGIIITDEQQNCSFIDFMVVMTICAVITACVVIGSPKNHNGGNERTWTVKEDETTLENRLQDLKAKSDRILVLQHRLNLLQAEYGLQAEYELQTEYELQSELGRTLSLGANHLRILALENKFNEVLAHETRDYRSLA